MNHEANFHLIIQARMTSTRLPGKVMLPLCGKTVLEIMFERLNKYRNNIIIATTNDGSELPIINLCKSQGIKFFQGSVDNVLERYYFCALSHQIKMDDIVVRITSDCPLIDVGLVDKCIMMYRMNKYDYVSNRLNRTVPIGMDVEVFSMQLLNEVYSNANEEFEKEHVTPYIYISKKDDYKLGSCEEGNNNSKYRLTLDEHCDYEVIKEVYRKFDWKTDFNYNELIEVLNSNPYITELNCNVSQKTIN